MRLEGQELSRVNKPTPSSALVSQGKSGLRGSDLVRPGFRFPPMKTDMGVGWGDIRDRRGRGGTWTHPAATVFMCGAHHTFLGPDGTVIPTTAREGVLSFKFWTSNRSSPMVELFIID
jgi:hypothetical protein